MLTPAPSLECVPKGDTERGLRLQAFRERAGLSQEAVARELGVSTKTIWNWERGSGIHGDNLRALAEFYDRSVEELQGLAETPEPFALARFIDEALNEFREAFASVRARMAEQDSERGQLLAAIQELGEVVRRQGELLEALSARLEVLGELQGLGEGGEGREPSQGESGGGQGPASTGRPGGGAGWRDLGAPERRGRRRLPSATPGATMRRRVGDRDGGPPAP